MAEDARYILSLMFIEFIIFPQNTCEMKCLYFMGCCHLAIKRIYNLDCINLNDVPCAIVKEKDLMGR